MFIYYESVTINQSTTDSDIIHFAISHRPTGGSMSSHNIAGLISEVSEEVSTQVAKKLPSSTTPLSFEATAKRNPCE